MASESETLADVTSEIRKVAHNVATANKETKERWRPAAFLATVADRIEAAWRRDKCRWAASLTKQRAINKELVDDVDDLRRRLKVAEDALNKCVKVQCSGDDDSISCEECDLSCDGRCAQWMAKNALAAIREEGGAK